MTQQYKINKGFTLVELMLAMSFIGMLLVAIAMTTMQIMRTYNKGTTIREVNQVGRTVTQDIQRTIAASVPFSVEPKTDLSDDGEINSRYIRNMDGTEEVGGRLCTGMQTYVWNYGTALYKATQPSGPGKAAIANKYEDEREEDEPIRLVKVRDAGGLLCANPRQAVDKSQARELLAAGDKNLAVQALTVTEGSRSDASGQALYAVSLTLGTNDQEQLEGSKTCLPPNQGSGYEDFCAINQFNISVRAGNRSGSL